MHWLKRILFAALLAVVVASVASAQAPAPQQQQQQPPPPPAQAQAPAEPAAPPVNPEEEADYKAFFDLPREQAQKLVELGDAFLTKYPDSRYRGVIYSRLVGAYLALGDVDKLFVTGEKALEINPDNVDVLAVIAYAVPRRINTSDLDGQRKLSKVEEYSKRCVDVLNALPKPEGITEEEFVRAKNEKLSMAHSGLALVSYHRSDFASMASELEQATQLSAAPDPTDFYLLGVAYQRVNRFQDAVTAFDKCATAPWQLQDVCKQNKEQAQKQVNMQPKP